MSSELKELLYQINHLNVDQMLELVKRSGNTEVRRFETTGPKGSTQGTILDSYLGLLKFDDQDGFVMTKDFQFANDITWKLI